MKEFKSVYVQTENSNTNENGDLELREQIKDMMLKNG